MVASNLVVVKRDGCVVPYDREKILNAVYRAFKATGEGFFREARLVTEEVEKHLALRSKAEVEEIQDLVEQALMRLSYARTAKAYILYRAQHAGWRDFSKAMLDVERTVERYLNAENWRVNENSNMDYSLQGLNNHIIGAVSSRYWLEKVYPPEIREAHAEGFMHIHDLGLLAPYCCGWDLADLLTEGFKGAPQKVESAPAKHFRSALGQIVNFFYTLQGEAAGAQALASFDTYLAPFVRYDCLSYKEVKQALQEFVFNLNVPTRVGFQTPFVNLTFDVKLPAYMRGEPVIIGGKRQEAVYGDFQKEMDMINLAFCEVMTEGDAKGRIFTFPIPTYNITKDFPWGTEVADRIMAMTAKYGIPYFANFIKSDMKPEDVRSMCPLHPSTPVLVRAGKGITVKPIREVYNSVQQNGTQYEVLHNGRWIKASVVANRTVGCVNVGTSNGAQVIMDLRHEQPVKRARGAAVELLTADRLKPGMYLPFNAVQLEEDKNNYDAGYAVGAYLGDGSTNNGAIIYSLNNSKKAEVAEKLKVFFEFMGFTVTESANDRNVIFLRVGCDNGAAEAWLHQYVAGKDAHTKQLKRRVFNMGVSFLKGVLDGWYDTDGGNRGRIYTVSRALVDDFQVICSLLGIAYRVDTEHPDQREGRFSDSPIYTLKFHSRPSYGDVFFYEDGYWWFRIDTVEPVEYLGQVYCFTVDSDEHLFQLANGLVTHNCRLRLDTRELQRRGGGLFGANPLTGSIGVVTINLPRLARMAANEMEPEGDFIYLLMHYMDLAKESLLLKRKALERFTEQCLYPYSRFYLRHVKEGFGSYWANHFNTIGIVGMHEACLNLLGKGIDTPEGKEFAVRTLKLVREKLQDYQEETGQMFNLEATPAEGTSYRLARLDKERYPDIITAGEREPYYTNSSQLPVNHGLDLFAALEHQDELQTLYTGGTVFHAFLGERVTDLKTCEQVIRTVFEHYHLPYFSLTPTFSICPEHGYITGEQPKCPHCGQETEVWSRVVGYYRPVKNWNKGKQEEFSQRSTFGIQQKQSKAAI